MSETIILALCIAIPSTISSVAALVVAFKTNRLVAEVKKATNGLTTALVESTRSDSFQKGEQSERDKRP